MEPEDFVVVFGTASIFLSLNSASLFSSSESVLLGLNLPSVRVKFPVRVSRRTASEQPVILFLNPSLSTEESWGAVHSSPWFLFKGTPDLSFREVCPFDGAAFLSLAEAVELGAAVNEVALAV